MKKKIGLLTITDGVNYGNRLQNYALQTVLEQAGFTVETIKRKTSTDLTGFSYYKELLKDIIKRILKRPNRKYFYIRKKRFERFNEHYIRFSDITLQNNQYPEDINTMYDHFVCGSDQIWNARFRVVREDLLNHLAFFAPSEKKISYAASFGTSDVPEEYRTIFAKNLQSFHAISVREKQSVELVRSLCGIEASFVLDPTMLLSAKDWRKIAVKPSCATDKRFIVTYVMSKCGSEMQEYIDSLAERFSCEVISLHVEYLLSDHIQKPDQYCVTPDEFVWLIDHAECVVTDSFHATVFSILLHKKFIVFQRLAMETSNDMSSRITSLLSLFRIEEHEADILQPSGEPSAFDYDTAECILTEERKKSMEFLKNALADEH